MSGEEVEVTFRFPREVIGHALLRLTIEEYLEAAKNTEGTTKMTNLFYAQVLEWREAQRLIVKPNTPAGADVIYTDKAGEECPAVLVAHRKNAEALVWFVDDGHHLNRVPIDRLRLAEARQ